MHSNLHSSSHSSGAKKPHLGTCATTAGVAAAAAATTVPSDGFVYKTTDVLTSPPTPLFIAASDADARLAHELDANAFVLSTDEVFRSKGFIDAIAQHAANPGGFCDHTPQSLNVCLMHFFGRCRGRHAGDPDTCQQLHIHPDALERVRRLYRNPIRDFFVRSFSALIPPGALTLLREHQRTAEPAGWSDYRRTVPLIPTTLDFAARDVVPTAGALAVEADYRDGLQCRTGRDLRPRTLHLCMPYASGLACVFGENCAMLHARIGAASSRLSPEQRRCLDDATPALARSLASSAVTYAGHPASVTDIAASHRSPPSSEAPSSPYATFRGGELSPESVPRSRRRDAAVPLFVSSGHFHAQEWRDSSPHTDVASTATTSPPPYRARHVGLPPPRSAVCPQAGGVLRLRDPNEAPSQHGGVSAVTKTDAARRCVSAAPGGSYLTAGEDRHPESAPGSPNGSPPRSFYADSCGSQLLTDLAAYLEH